MRKKKHYLTLDEFGDAVGLSKLDREIIRQKNQLIDCLKLLRVKKGISQGELARRLGTKQPSIARMEAGQVGEVSFDFLIRVGLVLGIKLKPIQNRKAA